MFYTINLGSCAKTKPESKVHKSGPAFNFKLTVGKSVVDIDFVPAIYLQNCQDLLHTKFGKDFTEMWQMISTNPKWRNKDFALIPKPPSPSVTDKKVKREWRIDLKAGSIFVHLRMFCKIAYQNCTCTQ